MLVQVTTKAKVVKLPTWLKDNPDYNLNVGDTVERLDETTVRVNKKLIRLGKSFTKPIVKADPKQAYEWVKTGHWSFAQFNEWLVA